MYNSNQLLLQSYGSRDQYGHHSCSHFVGLTPCRFPIHVVKNGDYTDHKCLVISRLHHHMVEVLAGHHPLHSNLVHTL